MGRLKLRIYIDGNYLAYRSRTSFYDSLYYLENDEKVHNGTISSCLKDIKTLISDFNADAEEWAIVWDCKPQYRLDILESYKQHRRKNQSLEESLKHKRMRIQAKEMRIIYRFMGFNQYFAEGFEADDCLATLAKQHGESGVVMVSNDKDLFQLLTLTVLQYDFKITKDEIWFREKYEINPKEWAYVQAIIGDIADNVDGIRGIGEKTIFKLFRLYKTFDKVIEVLQKQRGNDIIELIDRNIKLVTLKDDLILNKIDAKPDYLMLNDILKTKYLDKYYDAQQLIMEGDF